MAQVRVATSVAVDTVMYLTNINVRGASKLRNSFVAVALQRVFNPSCQSYLK
jgi:hypothetical protein